MIVRSPNKAFERAIDSTAMKHHVRRSLSEADNGAMTNLYTSRVFPMNEHELCVQFAAEYTDPTGAVRHALRGACLPLSGVIPERYRGRDGMVVTAPAIGLVIPVFPFDPALPQLESLCRPRAAWARLSKWLGRNGDEPSHISRTVQAYRLERRCVLRFDVRHDDATDVSVFVKVARAKKLRRATQAFEALRARGFGSEGPYVIPEFTHVEGEGFAFMNKVEGSSVHDLVGADAFTPALESSARILAKLHASQALNGADMQTPAKEIEKLRTWGRLLSRLYPNLSVEFEDRLEQVASRQPAAVAPVPIHTDFHDKQVIYTPDQIALIDCDGLTNGDPAQDYGNFVAHIELRRRQHAEHAGGIAAALQRFRDTYPPVPGAEWWIATTFLRLAAIYSMRPRWRHLSPDLLELADVASSQKVLEA